MFYLDRTIAIILPMRTKLIGMLVVALLAGCTQQGRQPYMSADRLGRGLVIVLSGVEGRSPLTVAIAKGLDQSGIDHGIEIYDWTSWLGPAYNQRAEKRNRRVAAKLARRVADYQADFPGRPVVLIGHSGGAAIAAWAAEAMPSGEKASGIIMLAPSLSPPYLLDFALSSLERGIINFYSERDRLFLAWGTTIHGTMDREHTSSAGHTGFDVPTAGGKPAGYERLFQIGWREKMSKTGHHGAHLTSSAAGFVAAYVAPFVRAGEWNQQLVDGVLTKAGSTTKHARTTKPAEESGN